MLPQQNKHTHSQSQLNTVQLTHNTLHAATAQQHTHSQSQLNTVRLTHNTLHAATAQQHTHSRSQLNTVRLTHNTLHAATAQQAHPQPVSTEHRTVCGQKVELLSVKLAVHIVITGAVHVMTTGLE